MTFFSGLWLLLHETTPQEKRREEKKRKESVKGWTKKADKQNRKTPVCMDTVLTLVKMNVFCLVGNIFAVVQRFLDINALMLLFEDGER